MVDVREEMVDAVVGDVREQWRRARFRPTDLVWIDDGPFVRLLLVNQSGMVLYAKGPSGATLKGDRVSLGEVLGAAVARERLEIVTRVIETGEGEEYFEFCEGVRHRVRVVAVEPGVLENGERAALMVSRPEIHVQVDPAPGMATRATATFGPLGKLSDRELEVLRLIAHFGTTGAVARRLVRSTKTVENQIQSIHRKLAVSNRSELVRIACEAGLPAFADGEWATILAARGRAAH